MLRGLLLTGALFLILVLWSALGFPAALAALITIVGINTSFAVPVAIALTAIGFFGTYTLLRRWSR
jgi:hypothetical protein